MVFSSGNIANIPKVAYIFLGSVSNRCAKYHSHWFSGLYTDWLFLSKNAKGSLQTALRWCRWLGEIRTHDVHGWPARRVKLIRPVLPYPLGRSSHLTEWKVAPFAVCVKHMTGKNNSRDQFIFFPYPTSYPIWDISKPRSLAGSWFSHWVHSSFSSVNIMTAKFLLFLL